ncbi:radical SAM/SPASM domain-containing protein [uncultured Oscillibacter sp.]|uniref:radical SAM/SPASM domain-containing protein n=1 Tax=uncultured Oscillibacter sp. TaxID=876091 RepID=UPI0025E95609|nr:radical SAM/SPASM domain-containing protein [uncultured Oscillibacter sp.]
MIAKRENLVCQERHKLEDVLPLKTPYSINIDPCNICNFKCKFCAVQTSGEALNFKKQMMPLPLFEKIVDDLSAFPDKLKLLGVVGNGEPLLNPDFPQMVRYVKDKGIANLVETNTNGSKLNPELNQALIESGLDRIRISVEAVSEEGYLEIAGVNIDLERFIYNIKDLHRRSIHAGGSCEIYIKTVDAAVDTEEKRALFFRLFESACDKIFIDHVIPLWADWQDIHDRFSIQKVGVHGQDVQTIQVCPYPFYSLCINSDGMVVLCCADWKRELVVGDLKKQTMMEIWNGEALRTFWIDMLSGHKEPYSMCKKCQLPMYDCNDNIDAHAERILKRMQKSF